MNVCRFRIACDRSFVRQGEQRQADFIDIVAWRAQAEFVCRYFSKGSLIAIDGRIETSNYQDKNGNNRTSFCYRGQQHQFCRPKSTGTKPTDDGGEAPPAGYHLSEPAPEDSEHDDFAVIDDSDDLPF